MQVLKTTKKQRLDRVTFAPDGSQLAAAGEEGVYLWTLGGARAPLKFGGGPLPPLHLGSGFAWGVGFVIGADCLVVSTGLGGTVVHRLASGTDHKVEIPFPARTVTPSPTAPLVLLTQSGAYGRTTCIEVTAEGAARVRWQEEASGFECDPAFAPSGEWFGVLARRDGWQFVLARPDTGDELRAVPTPYYAATSPVINPRGDRAVSADAAKLLVVDLSGDPPAHRTLPSGGRKYFTGVAFHPSGRYLAATNNDATVRLYDTETWRVVRSFAWEAGRLRSVAFSPDGMLAAAGSDTGKVVVWDVDL
jgi:WD40 repeat protein